jgi:hypothetical protein
VAQLGADANKPFSWTSALHVEPLNREYAMPPVLARAAQITCPLPSGAQLGAEVMVPARFFQPDQAVPLKWSTNIVFVKLLAAHTAAPPVSGAHDGSEFTVFDPNERNECHVAMAGYACTSSKNRDREIAKRTFIFDLLIENESWEEKVHGSPRCGCGGTNSCRHRITILPLLVCTSICLPPPIFWRK